MLEFFRGWKRKVGCVLLIAACVFAAGWVRSYSYVDFSVPYPTRNRGKCFYSIHSERATIQFCRSRAKYEFEFSPLTFFLSHPIDPSKPSEIDQLFKRPNGFFRGEYRWQMCGFEFREGQDQYGESTVSAYVLPYPLSLRSSDGSIDQINSIAQRSCCTTEASTMREFFRGWKRKSGCMVLVMACVFMAGWVRSLETTDQYCWLRPTSYTELLSIDGKVGWFEFTLQSDPAYTTLGHPPRGHSTHKTSQLKIFPFDPNRQGWKSTTYFECLGFIVWAGIHDSNARVESAASWYFPYWSIILPLTVLSAWLLLSKPRTKPKPPTTPASENA